MRFPLVTIGDMVNAQRRLIERLGITSLVAIGGSIGGFQALEWATRHPDLVSASDRDCGDGTARSPGHRHPQRNRTPGDHGRSRLARGRLRPLRRLSSGRTGDRPHGGDGDLPQPGKHGGAFWPLRRDPAVAYPPFGGTFDVEGYLHYHGAALVRRFDANSYLYLTRAMDLYDLGGEQGDDHWLRQIAAPLLLVGIRSDWLFPPEEVQVAGRPGNCARAGRHLSRTRLAARARRLPEGMDRLGGMLQRFLDRVRPGEARGRGMIAQ